MHPSVSISRWSPSVFSVLFSAAIFFFLSVDAMAQTAPAAAPDEAGPGFWTLLFTKGGVVTWVIALLSAIGLPVAGVKAYQFYKMDIFRPADVQAAMSAYRSGKVQGLAKQLDGFIHPAAPLIGFAISEAHGRNMSVSILREELERRAQFLVRHLARHIWVLELIAASAPLFGLLGTVLGMIVAFQGVGDSAGGADTALLAAGIWEALLTTAFGLAVALPFSILAAVFNNAVDDVRDMVEDALSEIMVRSQTANQNTNQSGEAAKES